MSNYFAYKDKNNEVVKIINNMIKYGEQLSKPLKTNSVQGETTNNGK